MTSLPNHYREAIRQLGVATNGSFNIYALAGRSNVQKRVQIMAAIRNGGYVTQKDAGINKLVDSLHDLAHVGDVSNRTLAAREAAFVEFCKWVEAEI